MAGIDTQVKKEAEMPSEEKVRLPLTILCYSNHDSKSKTR